MSGRGRRAGRSRARDGAGARSTPGAPRGRDARQGPDPERLGLGTYGYILAHARSSRLRTGATIAVVAVAVAFLIVVSSLSVGLEGATERELLDYTLGTPELPVSDFVQSEEGDFVGLFAPRLLDAEEVSALRFAAQSHVGDADDVAVYPYTERSLGRAPISGLEYRVQRLIAVDPALGLTTAYTKYHDHLELALGEHLGTIDSREVVLGYELWRTRFPNATVGKSIDLLPQDAPWYETPFYQLRSRSTIELVHMPGLMGLRLAGVLDRDLSTDHNAYVPLGLFANESQAEGTPAGPRCEAVSVEVLEQGLDLQALAEVLLEVAPRVSSYFVTSATGPAESELAEGLRASIYSWLVLAVSVILAAMVLGIANTAYLNVSQRTREIGTLRAMGMGREQVRRLVQWESLFIAMMGWVIGFLAGIIVTNSVLNVLFEIEGLGLVLAPGRTVPWIAVTSVVAIVLAALVGSAVPARQASGLSPSEALSFPS